LRTLKANPARRLAAILIADVAGYSGLMQRNEEAAAALPSLALARRPLVNSMNWRDACERGTGTQLRAIDKEIVSRRRRPRR